MVSGGHESETYSSVSPPSLHQLGDEPQVHLSTSIWQPIDFIVYHLANHLSSIVSVDLDAKYTV
jgi:hypothetical protein